MSRGSTIGIIICLGFTGRHSLNGHIAFVTTKQTGQRMVDTFYGGTGPGGKGDDLVWGLRNGYGKRVVEQTKETKKQSSLPQSDTTGLTRVL